MTTKSFPSHVAPALTCECSISSIDYKGEDRSGFWSKPVVVDVDGGVAAAEEVDPELDSPCGDAFQLYAAVFDGHDGPDCSEYCSGLVSASGVGIRLTILWVLGGEGSRSKQLCGVENQTTKGCFRPAGVGGRQKVYTTMQLA